MSLGPPFDESGERLRLGLGAAAAALLVVTTAVALLSADRSLGDSLRMAVLVQRPGSLHAGAQVRVAGLQIGEVVAIRGHGRGQDRGQAPGPWPQRSLSPAACRTLRASRLVARPTPPAVEVELRILRRHADRVYENSTFLPVNATLLTEGMIEIGPPAHGAAPGDRVRDGSRVRGVDPADLDDLLATVFCSTEQVLADARELRPDWLELTAATRALLGRLQQAVEPTQLLRVQLQTSRAFAAARALHAKLARAEATRAPAAAQALASVVQPLVPQLVALGAQLELLQERSAALSAELGPRRARLAQLPDEARRLQATGERIEADGRALYRLIESGAGTLGGFQQDLQIFDELKEVHRILKHKIWRVLLKKQAPPAPPLSRPLPRP
ncbi:MAG: hypothetical protein U1A78_04415 [Polyangia bacterium]